MGRAKEKIDEKKLRSWKLLDNFRCRLGKIRAQMPPPPEKRPGGPERLLLEEDYFSLMLFGMLNPLPDSMRSFCAASHLERVQNEVCNRSVSLGSFSEAQGVFDPELLIGVFLDLAGENQSSWGDARLSHLADNLELVDGTLPPALPRMHWDLWLNDQKPRWLAWWKRAASESVIPSTTLLALIVPGFRVKLCGILCGVLLEVPSESP